MFCKSSINISCVLCDVYFFKSKQNVLSNLDIPSVVQILMTILYEAAMPSEDFSRWPSASWGRVEGIDIKFLLTVPSL